MEADLSMMAVDSFDGGDPLFAIEEENETQQQSDADLVFQVTDTTVRDEHFYLSDEKPIETSDDEYELPPTDDDGSNYLRNLFSESDEEQHQETDNDRDLPADPKSVNFKEKLCSWVVSHKVKQVAVDSLLTDVLPVLPDYSSLKLPKTCRTLIGTAKTTPLKQVEPGSYFHFGLARGIKKMIDRCGFKINESLHMELLGLVNTDGLPVAKAFGSQVWPIQCRFLNEETEHWPPIVIGVYHGNSKPTNTNEYLADFVTEALALEQTGFPYRSSNLKITVFGFSCDAPANSLAKYIKIHTGYGSCPKCEVYGSWAGRVVLLDTKAPHRTHVSFINQTQEGHHKGRSILERLSRLDMIKSFAIDYMHCVCLGVMKKLLWTWIKGPLSTRIGRRNIDLISAAFADLVGFIPEDFARKPRPLSELCRWKAT